MATSIILGANGYIGRHLTHFLAQAGHTVIPMDVQDAAVDDVKNYQKLDITDIENVNKLDFNVDYIFVFAGLTGTKVGFDRYQNYLKVNEIGLLNILEHRKNTGGHAKIIFPSTRLVYKGNKNQLSKETFEKEAKTIYAQNKLACEGYLSMYANFFDIDYTIYRICVPYGNVFDQNYSYGTIGFFLSRAMKDENITLYGEGEPKRTFSHVEDICQLIINSIHLPETINETFNIGSNDNRDLLSVAQQIGRKYEVGVDFVDWPDAARRLESGDTMFDGSKLQNLLNYNYKHHINDWIDRL